MSTPINILDKYRQYSFQHSFMISNNTEIIRELQTGSITIDQINATNPGQLIGNDGKKDSGLVLLINTSLDSEFLIEDVKYDILYGSSTSPLGLTSSLSMTIREPRGIRFMNFIDRILSNVLKTSFSGTVFVLKTIFVGHTIDGSTEIIELNPNTLMLNNISGSFGESGGLYKLDFKGLTTGAAILHPQMGFIKQNRNLKSKGNTLVEMIDDLQNKLNDQLTSEHRKLQPAGRKVQVKFTLPDSWKDYKIVTGNADNYVETIFTKTSDIAVNNANSTKGTVYVNTSVKLGIPQILAEIFKYCPKIMQNITDNLTNKIKKVHKTVSNITSDQNSMIIHFDILEYYLNSEATPPKYVENPAEYGIEFDYLFSGANTDILKFDMNIKDGLVFLNRKAKSISDSTGINNNKNSDSLVVDQTTPTKSDESKNKTPLLVPVSVFRDKDPVFMADLPADGLDGFIYTSNNISDRQEYIAELTRYSANTILNSNVEIRGNPMFLNQSIRPVMPHDADEYDVELAKRSSQAASAANGKSLTGTIGLEDAMVNGQLGDYLPLYVKINIFTPTIKDGEPFAERFWYDGWFRIMKLETTFIGGEFKQKINMNALTVAGN